MATPYADLLVRFRADKKDFDAKSRDVNQQMAVLGRGAKLAGAAVAGIVTAQALQQLGELAKRGGQINTVFQSTQTITGDAAGAVRQLSAATRGLVSDYDLAVQLNRALTLGSAETVDEFEELARIAQGLGRALGVDTAYALESLNVGIARQSKLWLDNLGIIIDVDKANADYAASIGKTVSQLSEAEKAEAFRNEALRQGAQAIEQLGVASENNGDKVAALGVAFGNLTDRVAEFVAQDRGLGSVLDTVTKVFEFFGRVPEPTVPLGVAELQARTAAAGDYLDAIVEQVQAEQELAAATTIVSTQLDLSYELAERMVAALDAAKEAVATAEFDDFVNSTEQTRKNLADARAEMERLVAASQRLGGVSALRLLTAEPEARVPTFLGGPGGFALPDVSMPSLGAGPTQPNMLQRIIGGIDLSRMLETTLSGMLTGGISTLFSAGLGILGGGLGRLLGLGGGGPTATPAQMQLASAQEELAAAMARNTEVIAENTDAILGGAAGQISGAEFGAVLAAMEILRGQMPEPPESRESSEAFDAWLDALQLAAEMAERLGIAFDETNMDQSLADLRKAILATVYSLETFSGGFDFLQRQFALLDIDDVTQQFEMAIEFMAGLVGDDLAATLLGMIDNTGEFGDFIDQILGAIQDPDAFVELMAQLQGVSITEFLNWLGFTESALDRLEDSANSAAEALRNVPTGFKYALSVFQASDPVSRSASSTTDLVMGAGAMGGVNVVINVSGAGNPQDVAQAVAKEFRREYERGGYGNQRLAGIGR